MNSRNKLASHLFSSCLFLVAGILMSIEQIRGETDRAEQIKYPSPDGRFALRITQATDNEYQPTVELIEKDSGRVMLTPHNGSDREAFDASDSVLVWSPDSKRAAYGFRANPPGARIEERSAL